MRLILLVCLVGLLACTVKGMVNILVGYRSRLKLGVDDNCENTLKYNVQLDVNYVFFIHVYIYIYIYIYIYLYTHEYKIHNLHDLLCMIV